MTNQDIIRMAKEAGWLHEYDSPTGFVAEAAFKFAELVAAAERETCALICDEHADDPVYCGAAIRARGDHAP
jgi:hypothetical protein